jgi:hypothetical protein
MKLESYCAPGYLKTLLLRSLVKVNLVVNGSVFHPLFVRM